MKKLIKWALTIIILMVATGVFAQTLKEQDKYNAINLQIRERNARIAQLNNQITKVTDYSVDIKQLQVEIDTLSKKRFNSVYGEDQRKAAITQKQSELKVIRAKQVSFTTTSWKKIEIDTLGAQIKRFEIEKNRLFSTYIAYNGTPIELSPRERNRRDRGLEIKTKDRIETQVADHNARVERTDSRYDDLNFRKMAATPLKSDSVLGFEGIMDNPSLYEEVNFRIYQIDGTGKIASVPSVSFQAGKQQRKTTHLLPGKYICIATGKYRTGEQILNVPNYDCSYKGEKTTWFVSWTQ